eukprot:gene7698-biopygen2578
MGSYVYRPRWREKAVQSSRINNARGHSGERSPPPPFSSAAPFVKTVCRQLFAK